MTLAATTLARREISVEIPHQQFTLRQQPVELSSIIQLYLSDTRMMPSDVARIAGAREHRHLLEQTVLAHLDAEQESDRFRTKRLITRLIFGEDVALTYAGYNPKRQSLLNWVFEQKRDIGPEDKERAARMQEILPLIVRRAFYELIDNYTHPRRHFGYGSERRNFLEKPGTLMLLSSLITEYPDVLLDLAQLEIHRACRPIALREALQTYYDRSVMTLWLRVAADKIKIN